MVCIRNRFSFEQAWFNPLRRRKPEAFSNVAEMDPTENGKNCDFCGFEELTPSDAFGRSIEMVWLRFLKSLKDPKRFGNDGVKSFQILCSMSWTCAVQTSSAVGILRNTSSGFDVLYAKMVR